MPMVSTWGFSHFRSEAGSRESGPTDAVAAGHPAQRWGPDHEVLEVAVQEARPTQPLVSVVVAAFQADRFLADALSSVGAQTYRRVETVVVDDGSTDSTSDIVARFPEVRLVRHDENRGPAAARNTGVAVATGELVTFLDADDTMFPHRIETQVRFLERDPACVCVLARHQAWAEDGLDPSWLPRDPVYGDLGGVEPLSAMVRAWAVRAEPFDPAYRSGEGLEWLARVAERAGRVEVCPEVLWRRRLHGQNASRDRAALREAMLRMARARIAEWRP